jgi:hypothetical protein
VAAELRLVGIQASPAESCGHGGRRPCVHRHERRECRIDVIKKLE